MVGVATAADRIVEGRSAADRTVADRTPEPVVVLNTGAGRTGAGRTAAPDRAASQRASKAVAFAAAAPADSRRRSSLALHERRASARAGTFEPASSVRLVPALATFAGAAAVETTAGRARVVAVETTARCARAAGVETTARRARVATESAKPPSAIRRTAAAPIAAAQWPVATKVTGRRAPSMRTPVEPDSPGPSSGRVPAAEPNAWAAPRRTDRRGAQNGGGSEASNALDPRLGAGSIRSRFCHRSACET